MDNELLPRWLVLVFVFGVMDDVAELLEPLAHLEPIIRSGGDSLVSISLCVTESSAEAASEYAKQAVERLLRRSAMVQSAIQQT